MSINLNTDNDYYYTEKFKVMIRSNKEYLYNNSGYLGLTNSQIIEVNKYDFYKLCHYINMPHHLIWVTAYINDIIDPFAKLDIDKLLGFKSPNEKHILNLVLLSNIIVK